LKIRDVALCQSGDFELSRAEKLEHAAIAPVTSVFHVEWADASEQGEGGASATIKREDRPAVDVRHKPRDLEGCEVDLSAVRPPLHTQRRFRESLLPFLGLLAAFFLDDFFLAATLHLLCLGYAFDITVLGTGELMSITFTSGNMFDDDSTIRVNTVNCVGVMGKGVALAFKTRYPTMFLEYRRACRTGMIQPGQLQVCGPEKGQIILNFPTKRHWRDNSRYEDIRSGLKALRSYLSVQGAVKVSVPALGCGHGGLDWKIVSSMIEEELGSADEFGQVLEAEIRVYSPQDSRIIT
jgi:O-acetyl-ADP-ribose deacetylase (regulator of RNase III)